LRTKIKRTLLMVCLFLFLFVVIGGGLHLSAGGALIAAATGTPLLIYGFSRWLTRGLVEPDLRFRRKCHSATCGGLAERRTKSPSCEVEDVDVSD
jgi:hypothetical protein